jgi:AAA family ATP:ADP antiporter
VTNYLENALNVRRNEFTPASLLFIYLFLIIGCYVMGQAVGVSLFLNAYPKSLPHAMIATAIVVGVFASVYIRLSRRIRMEFLMIGSLLFFASSFALFWWLTRSSGKWVYLLIYIWVYMTGAMGPTMGWTLANFALTTREARRIFGFIGAGAVLGGPCAGFITADALRHGRVRPETLLLVMVLCLASCATLVHFLFQSTRHRLAGVNLAVSADRDVPRNLRQMWAYIQNSRYLLLITALIAVGCASTMILTYQFQVIAKASYGADKAALAAFFGRFNGYAGLAAFLLQMLLTGRLLRWFGIRVTLFVLPVVFIAGSLGVLAAPMLLTACILKGSHNLLRYSLDKSSTELLYLPVVPPDVKNQIKSFIDGFVWRTADGVAGVALLLFATGLKLSPGRVSLVNLVFLVAWLGIAYGVRGEYLKVLRRAIERRTLDPERTAAGILDSTTTEVLAHALERGGEQQVLYGLSLFEVGRETGWHPALRGLLEHASPAVRRQALRLLAEGGDREILPQVEGMVGDENFDVRTEALRYLVVHAGRDPLSLLTAEYDFPTYALQGAIVVYLVRTGDPHFSAATGLIFHEMLAQTGPDAAPSRAEAARVLGMIPPPFALHSELLKLLRDEDPEVAEQALLSAGKIQGREFLPLVIEKLGEPRLMVAARAALVQYGDRALGTLQDYLKDPSIPLPTRKQIPHVLARIPLPESATALTNCLVQSDPGLRFDVLKALNKLRRLNPALVPTHQLFADLLEAELMGYYRSFQVLAALDPVASTAQHPLGSEPLLTCALRERMEYEFERLFRLLALLYSPQDIHNAYVGLASGRAQLRANALEVLEHSLRQDLYQRLHYALDPEITLEERLAFARRLCHTHVDSRAEALRILIHSADRWLCACALYTVGELCLTELSGDVRQMRCEADPLLAETWQWTCRRLDASLAA